MTTMKFFALRAFASVLCASLLAFAALAQPTRTPDASPPRAIDLRESRAIPFVSSGLPGDPAVPVVEVMINGRGPFRFGFETGAGFVGVNPGFSARLGLTPGANGAVLLDSVSLPGVTFRGVTVTELSRGATGVDGILGLPFYQELLLTLDYPARVVRLERGALPAPGADDRVLPITRIGPFWGVAVRLGDVETRAVIDTRSMTAMSVRPRTADSLRFRAPPMVIGKARGAGFAETDLLEGELDGVVSLGPYRIAAPRLGVSALPPAFPQDPILGSGVLSAFRVTLDQSNRRVRLVRDGPREFALATSRPMIRQVSPGGAPAAGTPTSVTPRRLGAALGFMNGGERVRIEQVLEGTVAERAGLKAGDEIVMVNGQAMSTITEGRLGELIRGPGELVLTIERGGKRLDVRIP
jgi:hypothetical protein